MKIDKKTIVRWKVYLDRSRVYVALIQFMLIGLILLKNVGVDLTLPLAILSTVGLLGVALVVGYLDNILGIRSEEFRNLSESNPVMMDILRMLEKDANGRYIHGPSPDTKLIITTDDMEILKEREVNVQHLITSFGLLMSRQEAGLSLRDVSQKTGISVSTISRIEKGKECKLSNINKLIQFYEDRKSPTGILSSTGEPPEVTLFSQSGAAAEAGGNDKPADSDIQESGQVNEVDKEIHAQEVQHQNQGQ